MRFSASVPAPETAVAPLDRLAAMATAVARPLATMAAPRSVSISTLPFAEVSAVGVANAAPRTKALTSFCTSLRLRLTPTDTDLLAPLVLAEMPIALAATSDSMRVLPLAWMLTSPSVVTVAALSMVASVLAAILFIAITGATVMALLSALVLTSSAKAELMISAWICPSESAATLRSPAKSSGVDSMRAVVLNLFWPARLVPSTPSTML